MDQNTKKVVQTNRNDFFGLKKHQNPCFSRGKSIQAPGDPSDPPMVPMHDLTPKAASHKKIFQKILKLAIFSQKAFSAKTAFFQKFRGSQNLANLQNGLKSAQNEI